MAEEHLWIDEEKDLDLGRRADENEKGPETRTSGTPTDVSSWESQKNPVKKQ